MKSRILILVFFFSLVLGRVARADEGMWLLHLLGEQVYNDMVKRGLKLSKEQLYSLNKASLKDAIIIFGGGCTGEIVSSEGLIFTNHHCGYDAIASASSLQNNYLRDGFWAKSKTDEIPAQGLTATFLIRIEDVTAQVEEQVKGLAAAERLSKLQSVFPEVVKKFTEGTGYDGQVYSMFKGNQFLLFIYERYRDIRLVGTPPESIGKFGGDTDNWEWPRHTGDFSVFRVYAGKDNKPADFSKENTPLKPRYFLPVSIKGYADGDYAMIYGYPGGTNRYETSYGVKLKTSVENPALVGLRDVRLKLMFDEMKKDPAVRLALASSYASIANYWKFFDGETKQLLKYDVLGQKQRIEDKFNAWAKGKPDYENIFDNYRKNYEEWTPYAKHRMYINEGILGSPLIQYVASMQALDRALSKKEVNMDEVVKVTQSLTNSRKSFLGRENKASDQKILAAMARMFYEDIEASQHPKGYFEKLSMQFGDLHTASTWDKLAADVFSRTLVFNDAQWEALMAKPDLTVLQGDPAYSYMSTFIRNYSENYGPMSARFNAQNAELGRLYLKGTMEMSPGEKRYPDANFSMRLSYGNVKSYKPRDAVFYDYVCTLGGVVEKYKPGDYEYDLPAGLLEAYRQKNFGPYKDSKVNDVVVSFITTNDITGGNSGSPVLNAKGELIGLAFDGNYEALSHKIAFDKDLNRTICVDVRYVLWCIDILGGAKNIIAELSLK
ncbi:MAG: S46 family peptidase [Cyclobacteriaceae bacterium]|nr:S46 family peptidase [Cyclobacteriaceae bacterium]